MSRTSGPDNRVLVANADDLNHEEAINEAVSATCAKGIVKSATVIVNRHIMKSTDAIVSGFPHVSFGLHFNLSRYGPVTSPRKVPSLLSGQEFHDGSHIESLFRAVTNFKESEVVLELGAQFARFVHVFGLPPTHIDSHHYVHSLPPVSHVVQEFATKHGLPIRRPGNPYQGESPIANGVMVTDSLSFGFRNIEPTDEAFTRLLENLKSGWTELVCHIRAPGRSRSARSLAREREMHVLSSDLALAALQSEGIRVCSYNDLRNNCREG